MQYMLLIYEDEKQWAARSEKDRGEIFQAYGQFHQAVNQSGHFRAGAPLQPSHTATTVRVRGGKAVTTDGPFAETREQLGGYYLIEARDLDDAIAVAARIPSAAHGSIEVRPIMKIEM